MTNPGESIFDRLAQVYKDGKPTGEIKYHDTHWVMGPNKLEPGENVAGYRYPTGALAEFVKDELGVDPRFFCFSRGTYYVLIAKASSDMILLEKRDWDSDQKTEYDLLASGEWAVVEDVYYDLDKDSQ